MSSVDHKCVFPIERIKHAFCCRCFWTGPHREDEDYTADIEQHMLVDCEPDLSNLREISQAERDSIAALIDRMPAR